MQLALWNDVPEPTAGAGPVAQPRGAAVLQSRGDRGHMESSPRGELATSPGELEHLKACATRYVAEARAENTRRAYAHDWRAFEQWCAPRGLAPLPATPDVLALYLTHLAELGRRPSSIRRARIAIGREHGERGLPRPDQHPAIRTLERGIARALGAREEGAPPLLDHQLAQTVQGLGQSPRDVRDRALLLLGFAGAFRASDLASLNIPDITFTEAGVEVLVRRSKEDQLGRGQVTHVPAGQCQATCPVRALRRWLERVGRPAGPLFRVVIGRSIEHERISTRAVTRAVQRAARRAGLQGDYSSHSLRAGLATSAYAHGATRREIQHQGRWQDPRSVDRYIHMQRVPGRKNVTDGLL